MQKWYQLGGNSTIFWDPTQPNEQSKTLILGEVKQLKVTDKVTERVRAGGLTVLSESEAKELLKETAEAQKETEAQKKLDKASEKEELAKELIKEAQLKIKAVDDLSSENDQLKTDNAALIARIQELENPPVVVPDGETEKTGKKK